MQRGIAYALVAAALFGASTPLAKMLLGEVHPLALAGLLYLGSGVGLGVVQLLRVCVLRNATPVAWPSRQGWVWLSAAICFGGICGPVLLMFGLLTVAASTASLLLNLESALTAMIAWIVFREYFDRRIAWGMFAIVAGGIVLSIGGDGIGGMSLGVLLVAAACLCWAVDNNLTRKVSTNDPILIAGLKGGVAGVVNLSIASSAGVMLPGAKIGAMAAIVGFIGYGVSLVLFVLALRSLGTARTGAYFGIAPFFGGVLGVTLLGDSITVQLVVAAGLMALGLWLHLSEHHEHDHIHDRKEHMHAHWHDEHHQHDHEFEWDGREPHVHVHLHEATVHRHVHFPDVDHRHRHNRS
jgi:drug/metabolite transporter (DMT)-like permease